MQHKKILKKLMDHLRKHYDIMNSQIHVRDLIATQVGTDPEPFGEFDAEDVKSETGTQNRKKNESELQVIRRMMLHLVDLTKCADEIHKEENFIMPPADTSQPETKQTFIMNPKKLNDVTRLTLNEGSLYPHKKRGPLSYRGYKILLRAIERMASDFPENLQLVISSVPVKMMSESEDKSAIKKVATLRNMMIVVDCGKHPVVRSTPKLFPTYRQDPVYPGIELHYAIDIVKFNNLLENECQILVKKILASPQHVTLEDVNSLERFCHHIDTESDEFYKLINALDYIKTLIETQKLALLQSDKRLEVGKNLQSVVENVIKSIKEKKLLPLSAPIVSGKEDDDYSTNFIFGGDCISKTAGKAKFHLAVDLCIDNQHYVAKRRIKQKIDSTRQKMESALPAQAAHVVSSNYVKIIRRNTFVSDIITHADSRKPRIQTGEEDYEYKIRRRFITPKFGTQTIIDIYPNRKLSHLKGELGTAVKEHNHFMLKLEALHLYQLNQPTEFFQIEHLIKQHILAPAIEFLTTIDRKLREQKISLAFVPIFKNKLELYMKNVQPGSYPIDILRELKLELKKHLRISLEPIQRTIDLMQTESTNSEKLRQEYKHIDLILQAEAKYGETKDDMETAVIPYRDARVERQKILLMYAAKNNDKELMSKLISHDHINVNYRDEFGRTALHYAMSKKHLDIAQLLLNSGADPAIPDAEGNTFLHLAAKIGSSSILTAILHLRPDLDINATNLARDTPALIAAKLQNQRFLSKLCEYKLDLNAVDSSGHTILDYASLKNDWGLIVKALLRLPARKLPHVDPYELLQAFFNQLKSEPSIMKTSEILADTFTGKNALGKLFLKDKTTTQFFHEFLFPHLFTIYYNDYRQIYEALFAKNLISDKELRFQNALGDTLLHVAASSNMPSVIRAALDRGADISICNNRGLTPVHVAVFNNDILAVTEFLKRGVDPNLRDKKGSPLLHSFSQSSNRSKQVQVFKLLVEAKADISLADQEGMTLMHRISESVNVELFESVMKISAHYSLNAQNKMGNTPAHHFADNAGYSPDVVPFLLLLAKHGADFNIKNHVNKTPIDILTSKRRWDVVIELLLSLKSYPISIDQKQLAKEVFEYIKNLRSTPAGKLKLIEKIKNEDNALTKLLSSSDSFSKELAVFEAEMARAAVTLKR